MQKSIWERFKPGDGPEKMEQVIEGLRKEDHRFNMEGGSWTNNLSWVRGYENLLGPMEKVSSLFYEKVIRQGIPAGEHRYRNALFPSADLPDELLQILGPGNVDGLWARNLPEGGGDSHPRFLIRKAGRDALTWFPDACRMDGRTAHQSVCPSA